MVIFEAFFGYHDILILGTCESPIKWRQRPDTTIAVDWDVKYQLKQTNYLQVFFGYGFFHLATAKLSSFSASPFSSEFLYVRIVFQSLGVSALGRIVSVQPFCVRQKVICFASFFS